MKNENTLNALVESLRGQIDLNLERFAFKAFDPKTDQHYSPLDIARSINELAKQIKLLESNFVF